jgi:hypothetical protein
VYFEVCMHMNENMEMLWNADLFQDMVAAAVDDD